MNENQDETTKGRSTDYSHPIRGQEGDFLVTYQKVVYSVPVSHGTW